VRLGRCAVQSEPKTTYEAAENPEHVNVGEHALYRGARDGGSLQGFMRSWADLRVH
jgi:hypothetical protein